MMEKTKQPHRAVFLASIGSGLEYYCFISYALLSPILSQLFFVKENPVLATLNTLVIFAVGYLAAPIGALVFGRFADRYGRKPAFLASLAIMSAATFLIGILPTYSDMGNISIALLILCRLLQGFAAGAEIPGGITFIVEHANNHKRAFLCGVMFFWVAMGAMLSTLVNYLLSHFFSAQHMLDFGWRLAFWIGGVLGILGLLARNQAQETPIFLAKQQQPHIRWRSIFSPGFLKRFILGLGIMLLPASMVTFGLFLPAYYQTNFHTTPADGYLAMTLGFFLSAFGLPFFGYSADKIGHKNWYIFAAFTTIIVLPLCFLALKLPGTIGIYINSILYYFLIVAMASVYPCLLAEIFSTFTRYTGVGLSYMTGYSIVGFVPLLVNYLVIKIHHPFALLIYFIPIGVFSIICATRLNDMTGKELL